MKTQPRLKGGRMPAYSSLHPAIRRGAEQIARREGRSVSYVISEMLSSMFGVDVMGEKLRDEDTGRPVRELRVVRINGRKVG